MAATIEVGLSGNENGELTSRFQNLGEDVYREIGAIASVSLEEIDASQHSFTVRDIRKRDIGTVTQLLRRLIRQHHFDGAITLRRT